MTSPELEALGELARALGVHTEYIDGLRKPVVVKPETLVQVISAMGTPVSRPADAIEALRHHRHRTTHGLPPVVVAWDGRLPAGLPHLEEAELSLEGGEVVPLGMLELPPGYHRLTRERSDGVDSCTVISAPVVSWHHESTGRSWGIGTHLAALRSTRSRSVGDLKDLESVGAWLADLGGDLVTVLPLLPTFNTEPPEASPYSPVSRLFWSELVLDLGARHTPTGAPTALDLFRADAEVRGALREEEAPVPDAELARYAKFRGAQARLGRNWRDWPAEARDGALAAELVDAEEARFHLVAQAMAARQLAETRERLDRRGVRLGLDLAVGVHPDGYDPWSRQELFSDGMSVGAPPDFGFPSGQDWGFSPVLPTASRQEGHRYLAASIAHQASVAGVLRIDHIMAWTRLYWIPHGMNLSEGTYVAYPAEELFAILTLESHRNRSEIVGENLGTVPPEIDEALPRHKIWGMYLAQFEAPKGPRILPPGKGDMALIGTHDTPTFAGWIEGQDIGERVRYGLLAGDAALATREERAAAVLGLAEFLGIDSSEPRAFLSRVLDWLGGSESPLVVAWLEDFWLEETAVNLPGTPSSLRPNWQRPMARLLEDIFLDPAVLATAKVLDSARRAPPVLPLTPES